MHDDGRRAGAPDRESLLDRRIGPLTAEEADRLVTSCAALRPKGVHRGAEVRELAVWHGILREARLI